MKVYGSVISGNCLKIKYVCDYLDIAHEWVEVDLAKGESHTPEFGQINPVEEVPALLLEDGRAIGQSNAILLFLCEGSRLIPEDPYLRAKMNEWLFWEQYSHEPYIAVCRSQVLNLKGNSNGERDPWRVEQGEQALDLMNKVLDGKSWFAGDQISVADVALLAYTRLGHEGGFDLSNRGHLTDWIHRCEVELRIE